jgi:short-subunit dehydrogenase
MRAMASAQTLVLIGSGPMIGVSTASLFATRQFSNIALISRNATRLAQDRESVLSAAKAANKNVEVRTFATDITNTPAFEKVLREVETMGRISIVVFNAARVGPSEMFKFSEDDIIQDFKVRSPNFSTHLISVELIIYNQDHNDSYIYCCPLGNASSCKGTR